LGSEDEEEIPLDQLMGAEDAEILEEEEIPSEQLGQEQSQTMTCRLGKI